MTGHSERRDAATCGPYVCDFPLPVNHKRGDRWRCPDCGTVYVLSRRIKLRWWRSWHAPDGHWRLPLLDLRRRP